MNSSQRAKEGGDEQEAMKREEKKRGLFSFERPNQHPREVKGSVRKEWKGGER